MEVDSELLGQHPRSRARKHSVLIRKVILDRIASGDVDLQFRRWKQPTVKVGTRQRTPVGVVVVTSLDQVSIEDISAEDAVRAGAASAEDLIGWLRAGEGAVYRIGLAYGGPDPRAQLRETPIGNDVELRAVTDRLARFDASSRWGPWTFPVLEAIAVSPGLRAPDLASRFGRETRLFKADVRKLKELGLTESLRIGYRLSRRGRSLLDRLGRGVGVP